MPKLTPTARDELLIRLDQKVQDSLPRIEDHLEKINGHLDDHSYRIKQAEDDIDTERLLAKERRRTSKKTLAGYASVITAVFIALWKSFIGS